MAFSRKIPVSEAPEWRPWASAHFQTRAARDDFVDSVAHSAGTGWGAEPLADDVRGARVRWQPGWFLRLNDLAYAHGGRIVVGFGRHRAV